MTLLSVNYAGLGNDAPHKSDWVTESDNVSMRLLFDVEKKRRYYCLEHGVLLYYPLFGCSVWMHQTCV